MNSRVDNLAGGLTQTSAFDVVLRAEARGPVLARASVTDADLSEALSEAWFNGLLRRGFADVPFEHVPMRLTPRFEKDDRGNCSGFAIEANDPLGAAHRFDFPVAALGHVADRLAQRLIEDGRLQSKDLYYYELDTKPRSANQDKTTTGSAEFSIRVRNCEMTYLRVPLDSLRQSAEATGTILPENHVVFYTQEALAKSEQFARKGAVVLPAIETGAVLLGYLCSCEESGEMFCVICDALEVKDAEMKPFSLSYSGKSWSRIQAVLRARQAQPATQAQRIVGQSHGHNFLPNDGAPPCEHCHKQEVCPRTSVFVSSDDRQWCRAVFHRQPWALCHIFGLNARHDQVDSLYSLSGGRLEERGFYVIDVFDPSEWIQADPNPRN